MLRTNIRWFSAALGLLALGSLSGAHAQTYPVKPVRLMVGFAPGGGTDVTARILAQKMSAELGQPVVVENRSGAAGTIAAEQVAKSPADGYRLLMVASGTLIHSALSAKSFNFDRDFTPITLATVSPMVLVVHPSVPARNPRELITLARSRPGQLNYGTDGVGATSHLAGELFNMLGKVKLAHVPYKGNAESAVAVASGQVDVAFPSLASATPLLSAAKFRALAVSTLKRSSLMPSLPTLHESGLRDYEVIGWFGFIAPAGLPRPIVDRLYVVIANAANAPDVREAMAKQGLEAETKSPEQFAAFMRQQTAQIAQLGKAANIKLE